MTLHLKRVTLHSETFPTRSHYPFNLPVFQRTDHLVFETQVTLFAGENGTGKSTLLEALARAGNIHIWKKNEGAHIRSSGYEKLLHNCLSLEWSDGPVPGAFFGSETFRDFREIVDGWSASDPGQLEYFGGKSLIAQSHGQSTMSYFRSRYRIKGLYFLDEPETALSPTSQLELLDIIGENCEKGHAQFIIATHSPLLLSCRGARIYSFDNAPVEPIAYKDTRHYKVYRRFLLDQEKQA